jgi:hypothetical protein
MRFPHIEQLTFPCRFEQFVAGKLHADGRRYLPLIILRPLQQGSGSSDQGAAVDNLAVVDRHHVVDPALEGRTGVARLVFLLGSVRVQQSAHRSGLMPELGLTGGRASVAPTAYGHIVAVPGWETTREQLPYEALHTELLLDIGLGVVGVRTNTTAESLTTSIGKARIEPGDWIEVSRSRIDILGFEPTGEA